MAFEFNPFTGAFDRVAPAGRYTRTIVCAGSQTLVSFEDIPQGYSKMTIDLRAQAVKSGTASVAMSMRFNGDTGNNYAHEFLLASAGSISAAGTLATGSIFSGNVPENSNAYQQAQYTIRVPGYSEAALVKMADLSGGYRDAAIKRLAVFGHWNNDDPITQVDFLLAGGYAFTNGSVFNLTLES